VRAFGTARVTCSNERRQGTAPAQGDPVTPIERFHESPADEDVGVGIVDGGCRRHT
jgi:hypothetical protein